MIKRAISVEAASILWVLTEAIVGITEGLHAKSLSIFVFGLDSIIELIAGIVLFKRLWIERKGRATVKVERAERFASWVVGTALLLLAVYVGISAIYNLIYHKGAEESALGIILAVAAGIIMPLFAKAKNKLGKAIGSSALKSDAACSMVCAYMSWALIIGVVLTAAFRWWWIDSVISLTFVYFILSEGVEAIEEARKIR